MSQEIEIEFKNLLTAEEFQRLKSYLSIDNSMFFKQENHYFDTADFALKKLSCALRIRRKNELYEMTLKEPLVEGLLETNQSLTPDEAKQMLQNGPIPHGAVKQQLEKLKLPIEKMKYFGSLTTERAEKTYKGGLIVLDYSYYLNHHDYEIEYEVSQSSVGHSIFNQLLHTQRIPIRKTENKIQRFYRAKFKKL